VTRIVYVNGRYLPYAEAAVHPEDRGYQFADAAYEVIELKGGQLVDETRHAERLERSLGEMGMAPPMSRAALGRVLRECVRRNRVRDGILYLQVSRGIAPRNFLFPGPATPPTVVCLARAVTPSGIDRRAEAGIAIKTFAETRWARCDIKTVMLLPASLAKQAAHEEHAQEAWFVDNAGFVTEGASSNAWIIDTAGRLRTRACDVAILRGVTRTTLIDLLRREGLDLVESPFTVEEAKRAREAFITSATNAVMPVVRIDGHPVGEGVPGAVAKRLRALFHSAAEMANA
jgi:D-alanine transaminase